MKHISLVAFVFVLGCATVKRAEIPAPVGVDTYADGIDWKKAGDEAVEVLSGYLKIDTMNPPGNELLGAQYLANILEKEGIASELVEFAPGRASLIARLGAQGTPQEGPLCLLSHIDTVPAEADTWPKDMQPLSGAVVNGEVWGRGALDMKGLGTLELMTLVWLKRAQVPLRRDVVLIAVGDEEVSNKGIQQLVASHWEKLRCQELLNEGGMGVKNLFFPGQTVFAVSVAEKGTLWARLWAEGEAGHGSTPVPGRAPERLLSAIRRLEEKSVTPQIQPSMYELLRRVGEAKGGVNGFVLERPVLVDALVTPRLLRQPATRAVVSNTCQVTGFEGKGSNANAIPSQVAAILDCRLLPGTTPEAMLSELKAQLKDIPNVRIEVLSKREGNVSVMDNAFFDALVRQLQRGRSDVVAGPVVSPGFTDSIYVRPMGTRAYGVAPFELTLEELQGFHGRNERVSVANIHRGLEVLFRAVVDVSAQPAPRSP